MDLSTSKDFTQIREAPPRFICDVCGRSFHSSDYLREHRTLHTGTQAFTCGVCDKGFTRRAFLEEHMRTHTKEKPYPCLVCGQHFGRVSHLKEHEKIHSGERPYECGICGMTFSRGGFVEEHMRTHTGVKPFECDLCGQKFSRSTHLTGHRRTHTGEKPYECDVCGKSFTHGSNFNRHRRTHTGEKPYQCEICKKLFAHSSNLKTHMRKMHADQVDNQTLKCDICGMMFNRFNVMNVVDETGSKCKNCSQALTQRIHFEMRNQLTDREDWETHVQFENDLDLPVDLSMHHQVTSSNPSKTSSSVKLCPCGVCGQTFPSSKSLNLHVEDHYHL